MEDEKLKTVIVSWSNSEENTGGLDQKVEKKKSKYLIHM